VLPFGYEEKGDTSYAVANTATCLKMVSNYANAVFLFDNDRFGRGDISLATNIGKMNKEIVMSFYDLFCAGEEKKQKYVGSKVIDAGDIVQSLQGISTIGRGQIDLSMFYPLKRNHYREGAKQSISVAGALGQAVNNLTLNVNMGDVRRTLVLVCAPKDIITLTALQEISTLFQKKSPESVVRIGDYPRRGREISVTLILSKLTQVARLENIFGRAENIFNRQEEIDVTGARNIERMYEASKNLPDLECLSAAKVGLFDLRDNGHF
jgi:cell division GTPase FtsZ